MVDVVSGRASAMDGDGDLWPYVSVTAWPTAQSSSTATFAAGCWIRSPGPSLARR